MTRLSPVLEPVEADESGELGALHANVSRLAVVHQSSVYGRPAFYISDHQVPANGVTLSDILQGFDVAVSGVGVVRIEEVGPVRNAEGWRLVGRAT